MRSLVHQFTLAALVACKSPPVPLTESTDLECEVTSTPLSETSWSGPSEQDILAAIATFEPAVVAWDESTLNSESSTISFVPTRTVEEARVVERTRGGSPAEPGDATCRPGPELVLDFTFALQIDAGAVAGEIPGTLAAPTDGSTVYVDAYGPVSLDPSWEDLANTSFEDRNPGATATEWLFDMSSQEWEAGASVTIEGTGDGEASDVGESTSALWSGHWSNE